MSTLVTLFFGSLGGLVAFLLKLPIPWLVGSLVAMLVCYRFKPVKSPNNHLSRWMRVLLGVAIGAAVADSITAFGTSLVLSASIAILFVTFVTIIGVWYFRLIPSFNNVDAFMSALPGGLTFLLSLSNDLGDRFPKIALIHTVRMVFLVFCFSVFAYFQGAEEQSTSIMSALEFVPSIDLWQVILLVVLTGLLADKLKIAGGHIMFPMIISAICYSQEWLTVELPELITTLAMVTFGAVLGCKLAKSPYKESITQIKSSIVFTVFLILIAFVISLLLGKVMGMEYFLLFLALAPGGIAEISLITLALGFDVGFVAVVHTCRYLFIMLIGATGLNILTKHQDLLKGGKLASLFRPVQTPGKPIN